MTKFRILAFIFGIGLTSCGKSSLSPLYTAKGGLTMIERYEMSALNVDMKSRKSGPIRDGQSLKYRLTSENKVVAEVEVEVAKQSPDLSVINFGGGAKTTSFQFTSLELHVPAFGDQKIKVPAELLRHCRDPEVKSLSAGITQRSDSKTKFLVLSFDGSSGEHGYSVAFICYATGLVLMVPPSELTEFHWSLRKDRQTKLALENYKNQRSKYWPPKNKRDTN